MSDTMLVNVVNEEESRIAIVSGGRLEELSVETAAHEQIEGNIYKAKVVKIIPSLDAVFVDYGREKNGFLSFPDIHPKYFAEGARGADGLRRGQELLVQVRKGEIGQKGAALTTYVSIPGRYIVLMPLVNKKGVSRRIQDEEARRELKEVLEGSGIPEDMGYIVRTAGHEQTKQDLSRDVSYLLRLWKKIEAQFEAGKGPSLLYQESDIVIRTIRDYFRPSLQELWVDNEEIYEQVLGFFRAVMPWYTKRVNLYQERAPLFSKFDLENQIASIYEKAVALPSGGSIVLEQTEALVSVDVNSGKTMKGKDIEETAFIANQEAAVEVARQLRLRDLGGLVVIDFIDMRSSSKRNEVRKTLHKALKEDKARTDIGAISKFGLLELSRQRIKPAGFASTGTCPSCGGTGKVRSVDSFGLAMLRLVHSTLAKRGGAPTRQVRLGLPQEVAVYLLNRKRRALSDLETDFATTVAVFAEPGLQANQYYVEYRGEGGPRVVTNLPDEFPKASLKTTLGLPGAPVRVARPSAYVLMGEAEEEVPAEVPEEPSDEVAAERLEPAASGAAPGDEGGKDGKKRKRKRRRKKKGGGGEGAATAVSAGDAARESDEGGGEPDGEPEEPEAEDGEEAPEAASHEAAGQGSEGGGRKLSPSAKRRLRRRKKRELAEALAAGGGEPAAGGAAVSAAEVVAPEGAAAEPEGVQEPGDDGEPEPGKPPKKGRRSRRGGARKHKAPEGTAPEPESVPQLDSAPEPPAQPVALPAPEPAPVVTQAPVAEPAARAAEEPSGEPPKKRRAPRKPKAVPPPDESPAADTPKPKRSRARKPPEAQ